MPMPEPRILPAARPDLHDEPADAREARSLVPVTLSPAQGAVLATGLLRGVLKPINGCVYFVDPAGAEYLAAWLHGYMATWLHAGRGRRCSHRGAGRTIWRNSGVRGRCIIRRGAWRRTAPFESRCAHPGALHGPTHDDQLHASGKGAGMIHRSAPCAQAGPANLQRKRWLLAAFRQQRVATEDRRVKSRHGSRSRTVSGEQGRLRWWRNPPGLPTLPRAACGRASWPSRSGHQSSSWRTALAL